MRKCISVMLSLFLIFGILSGVEVKNVKAANEVTETESNNTRNEANVISHNQKIVGTITKGDVDYYKYTVSDTGYFTVDFSLDYDKDDHYGISIYDSSLKEIYGIVYTKSYTSPKLNFKIGTEFYIAVSGSSNTADYSEHGHYCVKVNWTPALDWELEENNTRNTASALDSKMYGTLYTNKDEDYYQYISTGNGKVEFKFINEDSVTDGDGWGVTVYDSDFKTIGGSKSAFRTDEVFGSFDVKKGTILYIRVSCDYLFSGVVNKKYSLTPNFIASTITTDTTNKTDSVQFGTADSTNTVISGINTVTVGINRTAPVVKVFRAKSAKKKITLSWKKASGVTGYQIYKKSGKGSYKLVKTVKSAKTTKWTDASIKKGKKYTYKMRSYISENGTKVYSDFSGGATAKAK